MSGHNSKRLAWRSDRHWQIYGGKENGKRHEKGEQAVHDQNMTTEKSWVNIMKNRTDKEYEE